METGGDSSELGNKPELLASTRAVGVPGGTFL